MSSDKPSPGGAAAILAEIRRAEAAEIAGLPTFEQLCLELPLYRCVETKNKTYLSHLRRDAIQFDAFCVDCGRSSTFKTRRSSGGGAGLSHDPDWMRQPGQISIHLFCQRAEHAYQFQFWYDGGKLVKFGQLPSLEDIAGADIRKYESLLKGGYFGELKRATGLASHGIGIGSFVYLRRIFERLIKVHYEELESPKPTADEFSLLRMDEKIAALRSALPPALVKNKAAYKILSAGIHELDEDTCRIYFPVVRSAIVQILEQDLQARERAKAAADLEAEISKIAGGI